MHMLTLILFFSSILFSKNEDFSINEIKLEPGATVMDLSELDIDEKKVILQSIMKKSNKLIIYLNDHGMEVYQILSIEGNEMKLELFDSSWFNKPTKLISYGSSGSKPLFFSSNDNDDDKHSQVEIVSINDIMAIQVKKNNSFQYMIFPILIAVVLMELLGI